MLEYIAREQVREMPPLYDSLGLEHPIVEYNPFREILGYDERHIMMPLGKGDDSSSGKDKGWTPTDNDKDRGSVAVSTHDGRTVEQPVKDDRKGERSW